jgi:hypothetical protein
MSFLGRWFNKRDEQFDVEYFKKDIPLSTIARWYVYDTELGEPNEVVEFIGLNKASAEGDEKEREDSDIRLDNIEYLLPYLHAIADVAADVITGVQIDEIVKRNPNDKEEIERELDTMKVLYKVVSLSAIIGAFASAMEIGLIEPGEIHEAEWEKRILDEQ